MKLMVLLIYCFIFVHRRDFGIYQEPEQQPTNVTQNNFNDKVWILLSIFTIILYEAPIVHSVVYHS